MEIGGCFSAVVSGRNVHSFFFAGSIPAPLTYFALVKDLHAVAQQTNGLSIFD